MLASKKAGKPLTRGELLKVLSTDYLLHEDPKVAEPRKRRMPPTSERPEDRGIPTEVRRAILLRSGGLCEFGLCDYPAAHHCHVKPHRDGSAREVQDLVHGCRGHHKAFDDGTIRLLGWREDGRPTFLVDATNDVLLPKAEPKEYAWHAYPRWVCRALSSTAKRKLRRLRHRAAEAEGAAQKAARERAEKTPGGDAPPPPRDPRSKPVRSKPPGGADLIRDRAPPGVRPSRGPTYDLLR